MSHPVDPTFRLNAPFRTDFGRNEHDTQGAVKRGREGGDHTEYGPPIAPPRRPAASPRPAIACIFPHRRWPNRSIRSKKNTV